MSERSIGESPLANVRLPAGVEGGGDTADVVSHERALLGHINLRGNPHDRAFAAAVETAIGIALPVVPNTISDANGITAYWLGPEEWLIVTPADREAAIAHALRMAVDGMFAAVTEVSGGQTIVVLRGPAAREILAKGCPLDLHPRVFGPGQCAQSRLARAPILVRQTDASPTFEIIVRRSFAEYLWLWLQDAAVYR
ncbi:MAG: sarcosine oxidase subunit gamma [Casimicrobiaceae bacterium]